jgi:3-isopropylmalate/(R)-2-methylmalate dehydratase small subunit
VSTDTVRGRVWRFGDDIDTDVMFPGKALRLAPEEAKKLLFDAIRPSWSSQVRPGDIVVGGTNFGMGSARPVGTLLRLIGIEVVIAASMSSLFQRNCINAGLLAFPAPEVAEICRDGDQIELQMGEGRARNTTTGAEATFNVLPGFIREIVDNGGVLANLKTAGYFDE